MTIVLRTCVIEHLIAVDSFNMSEVVVNRRHPPFTLCCLNGGAIGLPICSSPSSNYGLLLLQDAYRPPTVSKEHTAIFGKHSWFDFTTFAFQLGQHNFRYKLLLVTTTEKYSESSVRCLPALKFGTGQHHRRSLYVFVKTPRIHGQHHFS